MATTVSISFEMRPIQEIVSRRGLDRGGRVQQYIATQLIGMFDSYVPFKTGFLKGSAIRNNVAPFETIVYDGPYAARLYHSPHFNFNGTPMRGAYWDKRAWADHKNIFLMNLQAAVDSGRLGS